MSYKASAGLLPPFSHFAIGETHYMVSLKQPLPDRVAAIVTNAPGIVQMADVPAETLVDVIKLETRVVKSASRLA